MAYIVITMGQSQADMGDPVLLPTRLLGALNVWEWRMRSESGCEGCRECP